MLFNGGTLLQRKCLYIPFSFKGNMKFILLENNIARLIPDLITLLSEFKMTYGIIQMN